MSSTSLPVFHPDHPHNRQPATPLSHAYDLNSLRPLQRSRAPIVPPPSAYKSPGGGSASGGMSDSDVSATSSPCRRRCFCSKDVVDGGIYCSIDCARSDAFSSLCYKAGGPSSAPTSGPSSVHRQLTLGSSAKLSRAPSAKSASSSQEDPIEWTASHYRRLARADSRRDERREERRRRRAEGSAASSSATSRSATLSTVSSASNSRVPDLIGGYTGLHSRNASTASTASTSTSTSGWSGTTLSRNPSSASNVSSASRRYRGDKVGVIQEDADEEEFLVARPGGGASLNMAMSMGQLPGDKKGRSGHARKRTAEAPMGMGKDMRDILEEIISMEKSFNIDDELIAEYPQPVPAAGLFTATFDKPPRTPSPVGHGRQKSIAPNAPIRGHRSSLSLSNHPSGLAPPPPPQHPTTSRYPRPSSLMGLHQSSLSESHTALYLATASPVAPSRRSASPKLRSRNSLTFTPESAGPSIFAAGLAGRFDSPVPGMVSTPSRRRPQISPNASYGTMDGWRFPGGTTTPKGPQPAQAPPAPQARSQERNGIPPHLLWPSHPQFPQSPGVDTPTFISALHSRPAPFIPVIPGGPSDFQPPQSGMRLGVLLGSGEDGDDVEMEMRDDDEERTEQGHGTAAGEFASAGEYLPVFLEAEGFRQQRTWGM